MNLLSRVFIGLGIGPFVYLTMLYANGPSHIVTRADINGLAVMSILISLTTVIFDIEKLNYVFALILHYISVNFILLLISFMNSDSNLKFTIQHFLNVFIIYLISWVIVVFKSKLYA
uniref:DUF3021 family protein n=1 Tax=Paraclostridium bifermentans TaxID=1490 RepID=UPI00374FD85D